MPINFPTSLDNFSDPTSTSDMSSPSHSALHQNINSAVEALQAKVGVDSSAVTTSLDYKVAQLNANALQQTIINAKGDLLVGTADNTISILTVGATNGHVLTVDSSEAAGIKWSQTIATPDDDQLIMATQVFS